MNIKKRDIIDLTVEDSDCDDNNIIDYHYNKRTRIVSNNNEWLPFYLTTVTDNPNSNNTNDDYNHNSNCLSIKDLFSFEDNNPIESIFISNFMIDLEWLVDECPIFLGSNNNIFFNNHDSVTKNYYYI